MLPFVRPCALLEVLILMVVAVTCKINAKMKRWRQETSDHFASQAINILATFQEYWTADSDPDSCGLSYFGVGLLYFGVGLFVLVLGLYVFLCWIYIPLWR